MLFKTHQSTQMEQLAEDYARLQAMRERLARPWLYQGPEDENTLTELAERAWEEIEGKFSRMMANTSSGITEEQDKKYRRLFGERLLAALGGGLALIAPMLIMVLAPPAKATALATTCCFVLAVSIALAIFMEDSQPKDVVACIAAYTAVLVVFVGVGGGT